MHMNPSRAALPAHSFAFFSPPGNEPLDGRSAIGPMATEHDFNVLGHAFRPSGGIARGVLLVVIGLLLRDGFANSWCRYGSELGCLSGRGRGNLRLGGGRLCLGLCVR